MAVIVNDKLIVVEMSDVANEFLAAYRLYGWIIAESGLWCQKQNYLKLDDR